MPKCPPSRRTVLKGSAGSTNTWSRIHSKVMRSCFWKCFLSLQITLGWIIFTWVVSKFTAALYNCKLCSTELKLDYSDNKILSLKDLWSMIGMEENLLFVVDRKNLGHSLTLADMSNLNYSPGLVTYFATNSEPSLCNYHFFFACLKPKRWVFAFCFASANFVTLIRKSDCSLSSSFICLQLCSPPCHPSVAGGFANSSLPSWTKQNKIIPCAGPIHIFRSSGYLIFSFLVQNEDFAGELFIWQEEMRGGVVWKFSIKTLCSFQ